MLATKLQEFHDRRAKSPPLPGGVAPFASSAMFKSKGAASTARTLAKSWLNHLSTECAAMEFPALKSAASVPESHAMISLGTARPSSEFYPWNSLTIDAITANLDDGDELKQSMTKCSRGEVGYDLAVALNYGFSTGSPQLLRFVTEHIELVHDPPYGDWECSLTCGSTSAQDIALRMFCDRGDWVVVGQYTYSGTKDALKAHGLKPLGIAMDEQGLRADDLDEQLNKWDVSRGKKPRVLCTIPSGHNPTGTTQSAERRSKIYNVAEKHDLYILEDDPYYFLSLFLDAQDNTPSSPSEYLSSLLPSYLSLDKSGRVLRMDGSSKFLAPGLRCSWLTASAPIVAKFQAYSEQSTIAPSGPSQVLMYKLLDETWGHEGFLAWLLHLSRQYSRRLQVLLDACKAHLPSDICLWTTPTTGMFLWIRLDMTRHPSIKSATKSKLPKTDRICAAVEDRIYTNARAQGVLISKGSWFAVGVDDKPTVNLRLTFAAAPPDQLTEAVEKLGKVVAEEFKKEKFKLVMKSLYESSSEALEAVVDAISMS